MYWKELAAGEEFNSTAFRTAEIPSANGHGNARAVALLYGNSPACYDPRRSIGCAPSGTISSIASGRATTIRPRASCAIHRRSRIWARTRRVRTSRRGRRDRIRRSGKRDRLRLRHEFLRTQWRSGTARTANRRHLRGAAMKSATTLTTGTEAVVLKTWPKELHFERGGVHRLGMLLDRLGARRALVVSAAPSAAGPSARRASRARRPPGGVFDGVRPHTPLAIGRRCGGRCLRSVRGGCVDQRRRR